MEFTRRELLAGFGGATLAIGGVTLGRRSPRFSRYTYAAPDDDTNDGLLRVAWYETYNGVLVENHAGTDDGAAATLDPNSVPAYVEDATLVLDATGPVVSIGNVMPGDAGTLVVGLEVVDDGGAEALDVWFRGSVTDDAENGINEPEATDGDTTLDDGELDEAAVVEVWVDGSPLGSCNGVVDLDESLREPLVAAAPFADAFAPTVDAGGLRVFDDCLAPGALRCVALSWELPADANNRPQGDALGFDFAFAAGPCGGDSPFAVGGGR
jgi:hypothetical protein